MLLNLLNENEKHTFISLAIKAAESNGVVENEEVELISDYCREMILDNININEYSTMTLENIAEKISSSQKSHKKIILFEIMGLLCVDKVFDEEEKKFIYDFATKIGLEKDEMNKINSLLDQYLDVVNYVTEELAK